MIDYNFGICLVRSHRSNPALKQALVKARFLYKIFFDCGIKSPPERHGQAQRFMPQKQKSAADIFYKTFGQPQCNGGADLAFDKGCQEICDRYV